MGGGGGLGNFELQGPIRVVGNLLELKTYLDQIAFVSRAPY